MLKLCPWKKNIVKHSNSTISFDETGAVYRSNCTNEDVAVDFGNCSLNACPFYDDSELFANGCRRVGVD